jgi:hypothetical protein
MVRGRQVHRHRAGYHQDGPLRHEVSPEEAARRAAWKAEQEALATRFQAWRADRCQQFAPVLSALEAVVRDQWGNPMTQPNPFWQSLALQLRENGSLSRSQARYAVKALLGRQNKRNAQQWDDLLTALTEDFE